MVAGVVGARKFFYDVWGDAVNVAARMETTDVEGRIQVPDDVYERLNHAFLLEERGEGSLAGVAEHVAVFQMAAYGANRKLAIRELGFR